MKDLIEKKKKKVGAGLEVKVHAICKQQREVEIILERDGSIERRKADLSTIVSYCNSQGS